MNKQQTPAFDERERGLVRSLLVDSTRIAEVMDSADYLVFSRYRSFPDGDRNSAPSPRVRTLISSSPVVDRNSQSFLRFLVVMTSLPPGVRTSARFPLTTALCRSLPVEERNSMRFPFALAFMNSLPVGMRYSVVPPRVTVRYMSLPVGERNSWMMGLAAAAAIAYAQTSATKNACRKVTLIIVSPQ